MFDNLLTFCVYIDVIYGIVYLKPSRTYFTLEYSNTM